MEKEHIRRRLEEGQRVLKQEEEAANQEQEDIVYSNKLTEEEKRKYGMSRLPAYKRGKRRLTVSAYRQPRPALPVSLEEALDKNNAFRNLADTAEQVFRLL